MSRSAHEVINQRFVEAGLAGGRFINVKEGGKASHDHDTRWDDPREVSGTNYGIYADDEADLVTLDIDDHVGGEDTADEMGLGAVGSLPQTLRAESPHLGSHKFYKVTGLEDGQTVADVFKDELGVYNPVPTWGEVIARNKYTVGPGSVLDGCTKDWCEDCAEEDGGAYVIADDREIAEVAVDELVEALRADPDVGSAQDDNQPTLEDINSAAGGESTEGSLARETVEDALAHVDPECRYDEWRNVGFALQANFEEVWEAKEVFINWSRGEYSDSYEDGTPSSWDAGAETQAETIIENADKPGEDGRGVTVGTLVHLARRDDDCGAWQPPAGVTSPQQPGADLDGEVTWDEVRDLYGFAERHQEGKKGPARLAAARALECETAWMYVLESERLWVYQEQTGTFGKYGEAEAGRILAQELKSHFSLGERREIIGRLREQNQTRRSELNARTYSAPLLCVGNGVVDLESGELKEHSPEYGFVRGLSWDYSEDGDTSDKERILDFLDDVTERQADRDTLLDHLAHGLMPGHPYRAFVVCYGPGGNGKTQVSEIFRGFVGEDNAASVEIDELAGDDFSTGDLPGKFINWGDDMAGDGGGALSDLSLLKKATGGSSIRANEKFEKTFDFKNEAAMFFSANEPPRIGEQKQSIADRIYPIFMPYEFKSEPDADNPMEKKAVPNISNDILEDDAAMRGLLELAVEHAGRLIDTRGEYSQPESPQERLEKYNNSADPIIRFANTAVEEAGPDSKIRKDDMHRLYQAFAETWSERAASERGFKRQFNTALSFEIESGQSRPLATPDDDSDRVMCFKRIKWTEKAKARMPEWMVERYSHHFESDEEGDSDGDGSGGAGEDEGPAAPLEDPGGGFQNFRATVAEKLDAPDWLVGKGHLVDEAGNIAQYEIEGTDVFENVEEGDRVNLRNAKVVMKNGVPTVVLSAIASVDNASRQAGQSGLEDGESAATDGGEVEEEEEEGEEEEQEDDDMPVPEDAVGARPDAARLAKWLTDSRKTMSEAGLIGMATSKLEDCGPDRARELIQFAKDQGNIEGDEESGYKGCY